MVFICMNFKLSLEECIKLYLSFLKGFKPYQLKNLLRIEGNLTKNGRRKKTYIVGDKKYSILIQRMVFNNHYYFDLFPLFLIPNSTSLMMDYLIYDGEYKLMKRRNVTKIDELNLKVDLLNLKHFYLYYRHKNYIIYKSIDAFSTSFKRGKSKKRNIKKFIYIIYLL